MKPRLIGQRREGRDADVPTCPRAPGSSASLASSQRYLTERQQSTKTRTDRKHRLRTTNVSCTKKRTKIAGRLPAHQRGTPAPPLATAPAPRAGSSRPPPFRLPLARRAQYEREGGCADSRPASSAPPAVPSRPPACGTAGAAAAHRCGRERAEARPRIEPGWVPRAVREVTSRRPGRAGAARRGSAAAAM